MIFKNLPLIVAFSSYPRFAILIIEGRSTLHGIICFIGKAKWVQCIPPRYNPRLPLIQASCPDFDFQDLLKIRWKALTSTSKPRRYSTESKMGDSGATIWQKRLSSIHGSVLGTRYIRLGCHSPDGCPELSNEGPSFLVMRRGDLHYGVNTVGLWQLELSDRRSVDKNDTSPRV